jgi:hypothetical protein
MEAQMHEAGVNMPAFRSNDDARRRRLVQTPACRGNADATVTFGMAIYRSYQKTDSYFIGI